ncbi:MAG TPA: hypothetical protein VLV32_06770 [Burkholderiales bacterium]|nr:hypothetical protein [Burkholderiales bacterium]
MTFMTSALKPGSHVTNDVSLWEYLYRYLWPFWMFMDATRGSPWDRTMAYRHNREQRVHLPRYMFKWLCISVLLFCLTSVLGGMEADFPEFRLGYDVLLATFGSLLTGALIMTILICAIYLLLCRNEE